MGTDRIELDCPTIIYPQKKPLGLVDVQEEIIKN